LVEVDGRPAGATAVQVIGIEVEMTASFGELVACNAGEVGGVDEELALGDAQRQDVGDVVVGHRVAIASILDEAVEPAHAVDDARGVVGMARQRYQVRRLFGEALERAPALAPPLVDAIEPNAQLGAKIVEIAKFTPYQEGALVRPEAALDVGTQVRISAPRPRTHLVMGAEGQKTWIVDRLVALPADHHRLLAVVLAALGDATEALEALHVSRHQRVDVVA